MQCVVHTDLGSPEYMARFTRRAMELRVPVAGSFDLTYRCNLRCVHCYVGHLTGQSSAQAGELGTEAVKRLLAEAAEAGCLQLLLSGGEPLLRPDFPEIYQTAVRLGMITTVFTNAVLVGAPLLSLFEDYPPRMVEITVYGASEAVYERISGVTGSFRRALAGIHALKDAGIRVGLKTMILRDNLDDVPAIEALADDLGLEFRLDPLVVPRLDGNRGPLAQRVDPATAAGLEFATEVRRSKAAAFVERQIKLNGSRRVYQCGAGVNAFHIDPQGVLRPCLMSRELAFDAAGAGFGAAWRRAVQSIENLDEERDPQCLRCDWRTMCGYCPGLSALENGSRARFSEYACRLGQCRSGMIQMATKVGSP